MFDWLGDLFNEDTFKTIIDGANTVGSAFNAVKPIINSAAQLGLGIEGTQNAAAFNAANRAAMQRLDEMFTPAGEYAQELRKQMERKDAAAGRRSQYGTRETELMANLAKQKSSVLTSPAYQNFLANAFRSSFAPIGGAVGNLTGGLVGQGQQPGQPGSQQGGSGRQFGSSANVPGSSSMAQYLGGLFGPGADATIAQLGGAGSALAGGVGAGGLAQQGVIDSLGSMLGGSPFLPGYTGSATGIFGPGATGLGGATAGAAPEGGSGLFGDAAGAVGSGLDLLGGAGAFGGAGSALSGMGAGSLAGTVGGADALGGLLGGTGFLPSYGAAGGTTATGLFGGGAGASAAGGGGGAGAASSGLGGLGAAAGVALPAAVLLGGLMSMFQQGTQPVDVSSQWMPNVTAAGGANMTADQFGRIRGEQPTLNALLDLSMNNGVFDINKYNEAVSKATVGGKRFEGAALDEANRFGQFAAQNPNLVGTAASGPGSWQDQLYASYGGG